MEDDIKKAQDALEEEVSKTLELHKSSKERALSFSVADEVNKTVAPILKEMTDKSLEAQNAMLEAIRSIKIEAPTIPEIKSPEVILPQINVPEPKVTVNVPEVRVPQPKVTVNVPEQKAPVVNIPETVFPESMDVGLGNYSTSNPFPVRLTTLDGKPYEAVGGSSGGGKFNGIIKTLDNGVESSWNGTVIDKKLQHAYDEIASTYGDIVRIKPKSLTKFGRNPNVGTTPATIMTFEGAETAESYLSTNGITMLVSKSVADSTQTIVVERHTIDSNNNLNFVVQSVAIGGQNTVALTTELARATRLYNDSSVNLEGPVYASETTTVTGGVPDNTAKIHCIIPSGENQSEKASTSISSVDYWIITGIVLSCLEKVAAFASVRIESRKLGKVFRPAGPDIAVSSDAGSVEVFFEPAIIIPKNSDVRLQATASATGTDVSGAITGYLALIQ